MKVGAAATASPNAKYPTCAASPLFDVQVRLYPDAIRPVRLPIKMLVGIARLQQIRIVAVGSMTFELLNAVSAILNQSACANPTKSPRPNPMSTSPVMAVVL